MDTAEIDRSVAMLGEHKDEWATLPIREKIVHLDELRTRTMQVAEHWVDAAVKAKSIPDDSPAIGEEWVSGPWAFLHNLNGFSRTLEALDKGQPPPLKKNAVRTRANDQVVVRVFPETIYDVILLNGITAEVWMQPDVTRENLTDTMATFYKQESPSGAVALVLAAGNIASIAPLDVLYRLYAMGHVCLLKMNPVNDYLCPFFKEVFAAMIDAGFVEFVYGGADVGQYLTAHEGIDEIHITGSYKTHDMIVYGSGEEGRARKQRDEPILNKPMTSELGGVGPTIVLPGPWGDADLRYQAEHIVTQKMHNGGFNCIAAQVLVLPDEWDQASLLLDAIRTTIRSMKPRVQYYPGAAQRQQATLDAHPDAELLDELNGVNVPRTLITNLDPNDPTEFCFREEFFNSALAQTALPGTSATEYLKAAVRFANDCLHGTLGVNLIIHPKTIKELGPALEEAVADLQFGTVGVNAWTGVGYLLSQSSWGAYPGHTNADIQSGTGVVHNTYLFDKPQKTVVHGNFYPFPRSIINGEFHISPKPAWFVTNKQAGTLGRRFTYFEANPGFKHIPALALTALMG